MQHKVLVTYASKYGATAEIAARIGKELGEAGLQNEVVPAKNIKDLKPYDAVVVGSAIYMGRWRGEVVSFLKKQKKAMSQMPSWIFSSGPLGKGDPVQLVDGKVIPKGLQSTIDDIKPRDTAVFHGFIDMEKLNGFEKMVFGKMPEFQGDFRDWDAITSWARGIATFFSDSTAT